ncbi:hypothetical protein PUR56_10900, partial [Streptomyces sp. BE303]|nr:hypothetical protein [Streptomyces sp. BE303]
VVSVLSLVRGTTLGVPIAGQALLHSYGLDSEGGYPLWLWSVKSNIGHTQAAAGVAGIGKRVRAMREEAVPASLPADEPTTEVNWSARAVDLLTETRPWSAGDRPRRAGGSAFADRGTNAHVVVEEPPAVDTA